MSHTLVTQVFRYAPYRGARLLVLLALAHAASKQNNDTCWPHVETLAQMAHCNPRNVSAHLRVLEQDGWIERQRRYKESTLYYVRCPVASDSIEDSSPVASDSIEASLPVASDSIECASYLSPATPSPVAGDISHLSPATGTYNMNRNRTVNRTVTRAHAREDVFSSSFSKPVEDEPADVADVAPAPPPPIPPAPTGAIRSAYASALVTWYRAISRMSFAPDMTRAQLDSWIRPLRLVSLVRAEGRYTLTLAAPGSAARDQVTQRYSGLISNTVGACLNTPGVDLAIVSGAEATALLAEAERQQQQEQAEQQQQESMV